MAKAQWVKDSDDNKFYPFGHAGAVWSNLGLTVQELLDDLFLDLKDASAILDYIEVLIGDNELQQYLKEIEQTIGVEDDEDSSRTPAEGFEPLN